MPTNEPHYAKIWQAAGALLMARVFGWSGATLTQSDVTSIRCRVTDTTDGTETYDATLTVNAVFYNSLQTPAVWTADTTGYNFAHTVPAVAFPEGDRLYRVEYLVTPAAGEVFQMPFNLDAGLIHSA